jgi:hypothetical protein
MRNTLPSDFDILRAVHVEHAVVQPEAGEGRAAMRAFALRDFVLVVRELQVDAAAWMSMVSPNVASHIAEHSMCQPGRPRPQGESQPGRSGGRGLPQHEVAGIALVRRDLDAGAGQHLVVSRRDSLP